MNERYLIIISQDLLNTSNLINHPSPSSASSQVPSSWTFTSFIPSPIIYQQAVIPQLLAIDMMVSAIKFLMNERHNSYMQRSFDSENVMLW